MIKEIILSGAFTSAMACSILPDPVVDLDTLSPGVVKHTTYLEFPNESVQVDTSYQAVLKSSLEYKWQKPNSLFLVDIISVSLVSKDAIKKMETSVSENLIITIPDNYTYYDANFGIKEYSWNGDLIASTLFSKTYKHNNSLSCSFNINPTKSPYIYWSADTSKISGYAPYNEFSTFIENDKIRIQHPEEPYVSLSLDSTFMLHRGVITPNQKPLNSSLKKYFYGYNSKGTPLGIFNKNEKRNLELNNPKNKIHFISK
jgi:hypothetical protein